jgi:hypothetical protein
MPKLLVKFRPLTSKPENVTVLKKIDFGLMSVSPTVRSKSAVTHFLTDTSSSSSSSYICYGVGPLVDPFRSQVSRSLFKGVPRFLLPVGEYCFITLGNLLRGILFTC